MSRVGKKNIPIPQGVEVKIEDSHIKVKGPKGELERDVRPEINIEIKDKEIELNIKELSPREMRKQAKELKAFWGLTRALIANMVTGVVDGYEKKLQIEGLGYKASLEGKDLILNVGFSHPVKVKVPEDLEVKVEKNIITVSGIDKEKVGLLAAKARRIKPPEPYKGKGIRYVEEVVRKKEGKKAVGAE